MKKGKTLVEVFAEEIEQPPWLDDPNPDVRKAAFRGVVRRYEEKIKNLLRIVQHTETKPTKKNPNRDYVSE